MSSVSDNRPVRELIAEAKAEVTEEIEEHKEEEEEEETEAHLVCKQKLVFIRFTSGVCMFEGEKASIKHFLNFFIVCFNEVEHTEFSDAHYTFTCSGNMITLRKTYNFILEVK